MTVHWQATMEFSGHLCSVRIRSSLSARQVKDLLEGNGRVVALEALQDRTGVTARRDFDEREEKK